MRIRRVVTGFGMPPGGPSSPATGPPRAATNLVHVPGMSTAMLWATSPGGPLQMDGAAPRPGSAANSRSRAALLPHRPVPA